MAAGLLVFSIALAQAPVVVSGRTASGAGMVDVAYEELVDGRTEQAIERLERDRRLEVDDPAKLLNLGTAYARLGRRQDARDLFAAAVMSSNRYDLELADGRWMDSRRAARLALRLLDDGQALALR